VGEVWLGCFDWCAAWLVELVLLAELVCHRHTSFFEEDLPGGLGHPGDLTVVGKVAKADATHPKLLVHGTWPTATGAASICTCLELGCPRLLDAL
jgi:hypothetical protein